MSAEEVLDTLFRSEELDPPTEVVGHRTDRDEMICDCDPGPDDCWGD